MKPTYLLAFAALLSCASPPEVPPQTPPHHTSDVPTEPGNAEVVAQGMAEQDRAAAAVEAQAKAFVKQGEENDLADKAATKKRDEQSLRDECARSQAHRAEQLQQSAKEAKRALEIGAKYAKWVASQCSTVDTTGTHVSLEKSGGGVVMRTRKVGRPDDVVCRGAMPAGVTRDDVRAYLENVEPQPLWAGAGCFDFDRPLGLDARTSNKDAAGIQKVIDWKAP
jgi:hypothetical protein